MQVDDYELWVSASAVAIETVKHFLLAGVDDTAILSSDIRYAVMDRPHLEIFGTQPVHVVSLPSRSYD